MGSVFYDEAPVRPLAPRAAVWAMLAVLWLGLPAPVLVTVAARPLARIQGRVSRPAGSLARDGLE